MKKIIIATVCLLLVALGIGGYFLLKKDPIQPPIEKPDIDEPAKLVNMTNGIGTNEIVINGVTIKSVIIVEDSEKQQLEFTIESEKPLEDMIIEVSLLSDTVINKKLRVTYKEEVYTKFIIMDFTGNYNNPGQIYFNIEK